VPETKFVWTVYQDKIDDLLPNLRGPANWSTKRTSYVFNVCHVGLADIGISFFN